MVEAAVAVPILLILLVVTIELLRVAYTQLSLYYVTSTVARAFFIGTSPDPAADIKQALNKMAVSYNPATDSITVCPLNTSCSVGSINTGVPMDLMLVRVRKNMNILFLPPNRAFGYGLANTGFVLEARILGRREPD